MEVIVSTQMNLWMETVDLVYAYVNRMNASMLTSDRIRCVPADEIDRITEQVCGEIDRDNWMVQFYFQSFTVDNLKHSKMPGSCVAYMLLYHQARIEGCDARTIRDNLHGTGLGDSEFYEICGCSQFGLSFRSCQEYRSIAMELQSVDIPDGLRLRLTEALSNYHRYVDRLCDFLEPLACRLMPLLEPWWECMQPTVDKWREYLNSENGIGNIISKINVSTDEVQEIHFYPRIFFPVSKYGVYDITNKGLFVSVGAEIILDWCAGDSVVTLTPSQATALRLLSNLDRINMLRAMSDRVMTPKEITQELGLRPGAVFRDLNNLFQAHLVELVVDGIHRSYKTDMNFLKDLLRKLYQYIEKHGNSFDPASADVPIP